VSFSAVSLVSGVPVSPVSALESALSAPVSKLVSVLVSGVLVSALVSGVAVSGVPVPLSGEPVSGGSVSALVSGAASTLASGAAVSAAVSAIGASPDALHVAHVWNLDGRGFRRGLRRSRMSPQRGLSRQMCLSRVASSAGNRVVRRRLD